MRNRLIIVVLGIGIGLVLRFTLGEPQQFPFPDASLETNQSSASSADDESDNSE